MVFTGNRDIHHIPVYTGRVRALLGLIPFVETWRRVSCLPANGIKADLLDHSSLGLDGPFRFQVL